MAKEFNLVVRRRRQKCLHVGSRGGNQVEGLGAPAPSLPLLNLQTGFNNSTPTAQPDSERNSNIKIQVMPRYQRAPTAYCCRTQFMVRKDVAERLTSVQVGFLSVLVSLFVGQKIAGAQGLSLLAVQAGPRLNVCFAAPGHP